MNLCVFLTLQWAFYKLCKETFLFQFFRCIFWFFWFHLVPLYWREVRHLYSGYLQTSAAHSWINITTDQRKCVFLMLGWTVPLMWLKFLLIVKQMNTAGWILHVKGGSTCVWNHREEQQTWKCCFTSSWSALFKKCSSYRNLQNLKSFHTKSQQDIFCDVPRALGVLMWSFKVILWSLFIILLRSKWFNVAQNLCNKIYKPQKVLQQLNRTCERPTWTSIIML